MKNKESWQILFAIRRAKHGHNRVRIQNMAGDLFWIKERRGEDRSADSKDVTTDSKASFSKNVKSLEKRLLTLRGGERAGVSPTIDFDANQRDQFVFSKGYTIQGVPKKRTFWIAVCGTGFEGKWPSTASWLLSWQCKANYPHTHFRKMAIQKVRFFRHPLEGRCLQYFDTVKYVFLAIFLSFWGKKDNNPNKRKMANFEDSGGKERLPSIERPQIAASAPVPPIWRAQSREPPSHLEASFPSRSEWRTIWHPQSCPHFT